MFRPMDRFNERILSIASEQDTDVLYNATKRRYGKPFTEGWQTSPSPLYLLSLRYTCSSSVLPGT